MTRAKTGFSLRQPKCSMQSEGRLLISDLSFVSKTEGTA